MNNKLNKFKNIKYGILTFALLLLGVCSTLGVFANDGETVTNYKLISIIFIIVDIVLFFVLYFMIKIFKKYKEKINIEKNLHALSFGALFAFTQNIFIILVVICVLLFLSICEFAYLINTSKKELKDLKDEAQRKSDELNELLAKGNISYVMTVEGWYDIEKDNCDHLIRLGDSPVLYLNKELEKEIKAKAQDPVRQEAIRKLIEEYKDYSD